MPAEITKDLLIGEVVMKHPEVINIFLNHGLHCVGCQAAFHETIEQGCLVHGINVSKLLNDINTAINKKQKKK